MADIKVAVDGSDINKVISEAIINSVIGPKLKKSIDDMIAKNWDFQREIDSVVRQEIRNLVIQIINQPEFRDKVKELVKQKMTDDVVAQVVSRVFEKALERY